MPPGLPTASRSAPREVPPVTHNGVRYEQVIGQTVPGLAPNARHLAAYDAATNQLLWTLPVYEQPAVPHLERDVQVVMFRSMRLLPERNALEIEAETGRRYLVDLAQRHVSQLP